MCMCVQQQVVHLEYTQLLCVDYTSVKPEKKMFKRSTVGCLLLVNVKEVFLKSNFIYHLSRPQVRTVLKN